MLMEMLDLSSATHIRCSLLKAEESDRNSLNIKKYAVQVAPTLFQDNMYVHKGCLQVTKKKSSGNKTYM